MIERHSTMVEGLSSVSVKIFRHKRFRRLLSHSLPSIAPCAGLAIRCIFAPELAGPVEIPRFHAGHEQGENSATRFAKADGGN
jgi:hypothetical protein